MAYLVDKIKEGITIHYIETPKFKTNLITIFLTIPLSREGVTKDTLLPAILKNGTNNLKTQEEINKVLEEMYGATFNCGIDKTGDNHVIKFYLETLNDQFTLSDENLIQRAIGLILDIVFDPLVIDNKFNEEYVSMEKENIRKLINSKIDDKDRYALDRCIEEMYKDKPYGLYKYGYEEDLDGINSKNLYEYYKELISNAKIDMFISGDFKTDEIKTIIEKNGIIDKLEKRKPQNIINNEQTEKKEKQQEKTLAESMDITQGKLVLGLDIDFYKENSKYAVALYNVILGESATSKLFQNVREKASLAYSARSNYLRQKNNIFIRCGIEIKNYNKALAIIKEQLEDMKTGKFTDEDIQSAKKYIVSGIEAVQDEQDSEITYYFGQELSGKLTNFEEYIKNINNVTKEQILEIANSINVNTIYFLKN